ncbi:YdcF family protein [Photobacterium nomapromontoriensis]|uniref:YdcF family protein n=1 Tax=Photobacterium nomapromontoriensis TaxID=2910237 RepID=UPI003D13CD45
MSCKVHALACTVWDYHQLDHKITPSDCLFVLCSNDVRVAEYAAKLYLDGFAPYLIFSGGVGELTKGLFEHSEAEAFAAIAIDMGVPEAAIIIEPQSTNTGENIQFTRALLDGKGLDPERLILVQKPFMERRTYATFMKQWPGKVVQVTSPPISFDDYPNELLSYSDVINVMLGDLQRIKMYPSYGYSIEQIIPDNVWLAYEALIDLGFNAHTLRLEEACSDRI